MKKKRTLTSRIFSACLSMVLAVSFALPAQTQGLPAAGAVVSSAVSPAGSLMTISPPFVPAVIEGITLYPDNPLKFDFIIDPGDSNLKDEALRKEADKLIKYFMASLTVPEDEMWVNLSPYEKNRIISDGLSDTQMGKDLLSQDYILKQLTASLMYPEEELGEEFWKKVYAKAKAKYNTIDIPVNTFNKVWIVPEKANVYVNGNNVFVVDNRLKVLLEEDYLALETNAGHNRHGVGQIPQGQAERINDVSSQVIREVIIPILEKEVNEGKHFANLRQIYNSMILAAWYKQNLKDSLLGYVYADQNKIDGIDLNDPKMKEKIYSRYVKAFENGVYDYIKEEYDEESQQIVPRKYFSGGFAGNELGEVGGRDITSSEIEKILDGDEVRVVSEFEASSDQQELTIIRAVGFFPGSGSRDAYRRSGSALYDTGIAEVRNVYIQAAQALGFKDELGRPDPTKLFIQKENFPEDKIELGTFYWTAMIVYNLALLEYQKYLAKEQGMDIRYDAFTGESGGMGVAAIASGALSLSDGVRLNAYFMTEIQKAISEVAKENFHYIALTGRNIEDAIRQANDAFGGVIDILKFYSYGEDEQINVFVPQSIIEDFRSFMAQQFVGVKVEDAKPPTRYIVHSPKLTPTRIKLEKYIADQGIVFSDPHTPVISNNNSGILITGDEVRQALLATVNEPMFSRDTVRIADELGADVIVELGLGERSLVLLKSNSVQTPSFDFKGEAQNNEAFFVELQSISDALLQADMEAAGSEGSDRSSLSDEKSVKLYNGTIGLIGVGKHGQRHLRHMAEQGINVVAVDAFMSDSVIAQYAGVKHVKVEKSEADRILNDPDIKAVVIATPGETHYSIVKRALLAGKHVLVEKPFTKKTDEAKELVALAKERGLILMVGHNRSYLPHFQQLKEAVRSGKLGEIISVEGNYLNTQQVFDRTHTALEGLGYHQFYMIHDLLGQNRPDHINSGVVSEDWETVGVKLYYRDIPVTVKLSRGYKGVKQRNIIVRGSLFTAVFDYTNEPAETSLTFEPTQQIVIDSRASYNPEILRKLNESTPLNEEDSKPSLHHQLKVFREVLQTREAPPSSGEAAVSVVETLEDIRQKLRQSRVYTENTLVPYVELERIVDLIHERIGEKGGIVAIDGAAATGKSTLAGLLKDVYELKYPSSRVVDLPLDELVRPWSERAVLKKMVLGDPLTEEQIKTAKDNGWDEITARELYESEKIIWNNHVILAALQQIRVLMDKPPAGLTFNFLNRTANIKKNGRRVFGVTNRIYQQGDIVFMEGKFANDETFANFTDIRIRLQSPPQDIRERFRKERENLVSPDGTFTLADLEEHMRYYDKFCWPSWEAYEKRTRSLVDMILDIDFGKEAVPEPAEDKAMINGGIDLNPALLDLATEEHGIKYDVFFDLKTFDSLPIDGLAPVILQMAPITNVNMFLGTAEDAGSLDAAQNRDRYHISPAEEHRKKFIDRDTSRSSDKMQLGALYMPAWN